MKRHTLRIHSSCHLVIACVVDRLLCPFGPSQKLDRLGSHLDLKILDTTFTRDRSHAILNLVPTHGAIAHDDPSFDLGWFADFFAVEFGRPLTWFGGTTPFTDGLRLERRKEACAAHWQRALSERNGRQSLLCEDRLTDVAAWRQNGASRW